MMDANQVWDVNEAIDAGGGPTMASGWIGEGRR